MKSNYPPNVDLEAIGVEEVKTDCDHEHTSNCQNDINCPCVLDHHCQNSPGYEKPVNRMKEAYENEGVKYPSKKSIMEEWLEIKKLIDKMDKLLNNF